MPKTSWFHISLISIAILAVAYVSLAKAQNSTAETNGETGSRAWDPAYLFDQINLSVDFGKVRFDVATRPGETIYVTREQGPQDVLRTGIILMPVGNDGEVGPRAKLHGIRKEEHRFRMMPVCINSSAEVAPAGLGKIEDCRPRSADDDEADSVFPLSDGFVENILYRTPFTDRASGSVLTLKDYRATPPQRIDEFNRSGKCCLAVQGVEICSCSVRVGRDLYCSSGCPLGNM